MKVMGSDDVTKGDHSGLPSRTVETSVLHAWKVLGALLPLSMGMVDMALMRLRLICDGF